MTIDESQIFHTEGDFKWADEELALACLLADGVCFLNNVEFTKGSGEFTTCVFVLCSDLMSWGCADAESIKNNDGEEPSEIIDLYRHWAQNKKWGPSKWVCIKRNEQPQRPVKESMIKDGVWDETLDKLPPNGYDARIKEYYETRAAQSPVENS
jgi:hypothetical protein